MKRETLAATLVALSAILRGTELTEGVLELYYRALADLQDEELHLSPKVV